MTHLHQSPTDAAFVQNPYPFYDHARTVGPVVVWADYKMAAAFDAATVRALLRDRRLGRERPAAIETEAAPHLASFQALEQHSMLELEGPRHSRLRGLVLRAFTSRRIAALAPEIASLSHSLIDAFPNDAFDLLPTYCTQIPVRIIARLLGVPEDMAPQLLDWSHRMVAMYQAGRTRQIEDEANAAARDFTAFLRTYVEQRRADPADDLITHLIAAEEDGTRLSTDEMISTCILLLNAGHEATVHGLGNGVKTLLETGTGPDWLTPDRIAGTVEEILRFDPPLHMFTRYAYDTMRVGEIELQPGDEIAVMLGAANRDPALWPEPNRFDPARESQTHTSLGGGAHFCVGAPLARLEMQVALPILFARCPNLRLSAPPRYANTYHFHGLTALTVTR